MRRITQNDLRGVVARMARLLNSGDGPAWSRDENGRNRARVGALLLNTGSKTNGISWGIAQIMNESGGERTLVRGSTARELYNAAQEWISGYYAAKEQ